MKKSALISIEEIATVLLVTAFAIFCDYELNYTFVSPNPYVDIIAMLGDLIMSLYGFKKILDKIYIYFTNKLRSLNL